MEPVDTIAYVVSVEQDLKAEPPEDDRSPLVPNARGGKVIVTATCDDGIIQFWAPMNERVAVGDSVHLTFDYAGPPDRSVPPIDS